MIRQANKFDVPQIVEMLKEYRDAAPLEILKQANDQEYIERFLLDLIVGSGFILIAEKEDKSVAVKPFVAPVAAVPARPMPNLSMGSEMPESAPAPGPAVTVQTIDDFETAEQDFSKQKDVSIFEQLSHRYFLNYSKVFERKKRPDVVIPEEVKKN